MLSRCPRCDQTIAYDERSGDFVHDCNSGNAALDQEDVPRVNVPNAGLQGSEHRLKGSLIGRGESYPDAVTVRGNRVSTHETRAHQEYIEVKP